MSLIAAAVDILQLQAAQLATRPEDVTGSCSWDNKQIIRKGCKYVNVLIDIQKKDIRKQLLTVSHLVTPPQ
jgi:hypothetical protein